MKRHISVIGLGYVGLPVAVGFGRAGYQVLGFDIDARRIAELSGGHDRTGEIEAEMLAAPGLRYSSDPRDLEAADFCIVTVPTPIDASKQPDLAPLKGASESFPASPKTSAFPCWKRSPDSNGSPTLTSATRRSVSTPATRSAASTTS